MRIINRMEQEGEHVTSVETIRFELQGRLREIEDEIGKLYLSIRWESMARIVRVGACIDIFNWDTRMAVLERLVAFQRDHADEFAVEFDIVPLHAVSDEEFAEA
ncbi:hypothetical protein U2G91_17205 [Rhodococcoides fascians]|uniref:hypothetical protein n=1 Tax=Rhodococcoides fascians TaxID=1828 RepID=UPI002ACEB113|nr:hypothetical protein [Rhodococcus fascians]WQH26819.1 hypothetical protein U2G91_17205 [Rhodococcus fascians]